MFADRKLWVPTLFALVTGVACGGSSSSNGGASATAGTTQATHAISGTIAGEPGVAVILSGASSATTTTDSAGNYKFAGLAAGSYTVTPSKSGYTCTPASRDVTVGSADVQGLDFEAAKSKHAISGKVTGASGVTVSLRTGDTTRTATPSESGEYTFGDLQEGDYTVTPSKAGFTFTPASWAVSLSGEDATGKDFAAAEAATPTFAISGNAGVAGATVTLTGASSGSVVADGDGHYAFASLRSGAYLVTPSKLGYKFAPASAPVAVDGADATAPTFTAVVARHTISGAIAGGASVPVTANGPGTFTTTTDSSGRYSFIGLPDGSYEVMPSKPGYTFAPSGRAVQLDGANATLQDFAVTEHTFGYVSLSTKPMSYAGIWGSGPDDVWVVGYYSGGMIEHWDGTSWADMALPTSSNLSAVWGSGPFDVWAVGSGGTILHWDGAFWTPMASGTTDGLSAVWGTGPTDVWAVGGSHATILHWDGLAWTKTAVSGYSGETNLSLGGMWGSGPNDVWAAGTSSGAGYNQGTLVHWDGSAWKIALAPTQCGLTRVWGSGPGDVWAGGSNGEILHWGGALDAQGSPVWQQVPSTEGDTIRGIWGSGPNDVWFLDYAGTFQRWDGESLTVVYAQTTSTRPTTVWARSASDVWAVGSDVVRWNGTTWSSAAPRTLFYNTNFLWGFTPNDVWVAGGKNGNSLFHWDGSAWMDLSLKADGTSVTTQSISGIFGKASNDLWAVTYGGAILHWDGSAWTAASVTTADLFRIHGSAANDIWVVGGRASGASGSTILHWDGTAWENRSQNGDGTWVIPSGYPQGVWSSSATNVWITMGSTSILHWDGASWTTQTLPASATAIWGTAANDLWAVGSGASHYDDTGWTAFANPLGSAYQLWGSGSKDIWAVAGGNPMHWDGTAWTTVSAPTGLRDIWGSSASDVWGLSSNNGYVLRWY